MQEAAVHRVEAETATEAEARAAPVGPAAVESAPVEAAEWASARAAGVAAAEAGAEAVEAAAAAEAAEAAAEAEAAEEWPTPPRRCHSRRRPASPAPPEEWPQAE
jgi:hypothetical protein